MVDPHNCAELNRQTRSFLLTCKDELKPSTAAIKTAASPSYSSIVRKMRVSPTVTSPLTCGIGILRREATAAIPMNRKKKRQSSSCGDILVSEKISAAAPKATTEARKSLKRR